MRRALVLTALSAGLLLCVAWAVPAGDPPPAPDPVPAVKPFGIDKRVPWTTSHVVGSPNPPPPYRVVRAFPKLKVPTPIAVAREPGTDNLLLIHQDWAWGGAGRILRIKDDDNVTEAEQLLKVDGIAYGLAFHPDFEKNGYVYVGSNGPYEGKNKTTRVLRYTIGRKPPYPFDPKSEKLIIEWPSDGHNGGDVAFGPDGMLYVTSGDGTSDSDTNLAGQDLTRLLAKVLRIDVDHPDPGKGYSVPADNPFVKTEGIRPETWAYGFRNPWRIHVDKKTGDVWVGQNGQDLWEEVYLVAKGANYGWSVMEGSHPFYPNRQAGPHVFSRPIAEHHHSEFRSLTGGVVYRGTKLPDLCDTYVYGDWSTGKIWGIRHEGAKVTWHQELASTTMSITGFGIDTHGELLIADHGGNAYYRLEPTPKETNPPKFPTKLSETGVFTSVKGHQVDPGLIPYSVNAPLWSDGAEKERFIGLVGDAQIDFTRSRGWNFTDGTVLVKTFSLPTADAKDARRRIETRLLTRQQGQWVGYSYLWNDEQTDAVLVEAGGTDRVYEVRDAAVPGGVRKQSWHYPSRAECMVCHSRAANWVLGLTELQMNRVHDYGGVKAEQLRTLEHLGVFHVNQVDLLQEDRRRLERPFEAVGAGFRATLGGLDRLLAETPAPVRQTLGDAGRGWTHPLEAVRAEVNRPLDALEKKLRDEPQFTTRLPKAPDEYRRLPTPSDKGADVEARARAYLHANCAQCHVEAGGGNAMIDLEFTTPREKMKLIGVKALHPAFGLDDGKLVVPGDPEKSLLLRRLATRGAGQMPPLATTEVDHEAVELLREWIAGMKE
jgi:glucose/arabinose dehydrogenase